MKNYDVESSSCSSGNGFRDKNRALWYGILGVEFHGGSNKLFRTNDICSFGHRTSTSIPLPLLLDRSRTDDTESY
ncbi:hypothetical protein Csa_012770 [Cucumis sativus]|uniref:Uncharacterized protein n=1 Tax=Cucumis sativus TaxID=3659 RepID=A0A0A0KYX2_CUCSA|nr:hypothetical protein Csa_012770 [Cucumis sativus]